MVKSWKHFPPRSKTRQGCPFLFYSTYFWNTAVREEKQIDGIQIGKEEVKLSLFADDILLYIENPKDATRKWIQLINEFGKVAGYKINIQKSVAFLYIKTLAEKENKETIPCTIDWKRIEYLGINLPKEAKDLYSKNYKTWWKKSKMIQTHGKIYHILGLTILPNAIYRCNVIPYPITNGIFGNTKVPEYPKLFWERGTDLEISCCLISNYTTILP